MREPLVLFRPERSTPPASNSSVRAPTLARDGPTSTRSWGWPPRCGPRTRRCSAAPARRWLSPARPPTASIRSSPGLTCAPAMRSSRVTRSTPGCSRRSPAPAARGESGSAWFRLPRLRTRCVLPLAWSPAPTSPGSRAASRTPPRSRPREHRCCWTPPRDWARCRRASANSVVTTTPARDRNGSAGRRDRGA